MKTTPAKRSRAAKNGHASDVDGHASHNWNLRLYVAGQTPRSITAFQNLKAICEEYLKGQYHIEVVDLMENPHSREAIRSWQSPPSCENFPNRSGRLLAIFQTPSV